MVQRQKRAVLVVIDQGRIQRAAAEDAGANEVPERGADDVGVGKPVLERSCMRSNRARYCWIASMIRSTSGSTSMKENMLPSGTHMLGPPAQ